MSRPEAIAYADKHGLDLGGITGDKPYSVDQNLSRTIEAGVLEDPGGSHPRTLRVDCLAGHGQRHPRDRGELRGRRAGGRRRRRGRAGQGGGRAQPGRGEAGFGLVDDGEPAGRHQEPRGLRGAGRAGEIAAHRDLEDLTLDRDVLHEKARLDIRYAELVYDGPWFSPRRP